jgi:hypothetical protein
MAPVLIPNVIRDRAVDGQTTVDKKLVARRDRGQRVNEHTITNLDRLTVGRTRVVQKAGAIPTHATIDDLAV